MYELLVKIKFLLPSLPRAERDFAEALLENPEAITKMTLAAIATESGSSEASVIRFCKRLGFDGYTALKKAFEDSIDENIEPSECVESCDDMKVIAQKVFKSNMQTMQNTMVLVDEEYERAVSALLNARAIHFFAVGDANAACQFSMIKFSKLGISCTAYNDVMMQYITAGNMGKGDVAFAVSYEGKSVNVMQAMKTAKENGATTICITRRNKSPLLRYIDIKLFVSVSDLTVGWDKASRRVAEQFVLDVLYSGFVARSRKDFDNQLKQIQSIIDLNKKTK